MPEPIITPPAQVTPPAVVPPVVVPTPPVVPAAPIIEPTVYESAASAVEAWQKTPTPELKTAMDEAVKKAKEFKPTPAKVAPEKYDLKLPEGSKLDPKHTEAIAAFAKERGLSQEDAQALLERDNNISKAQQQKDLADFKTHVDAFVPLAQADKEIGGEKFKENVEIASQAVKFFGNDALKKLFDDTGYGNHPEVLRVFYKVGKAMQNDKSVVITTPPAPVKSTAEKWYPNMAAK